MTFTLDKLIESIAEVLKEHFPNTQVSVNQDQQESEASEFCIFYTDVEIESRIGSRLMKKIGFDVVYKAEKNSGDTFDLRPSVADKLDFILEFIPYEAAKLRTYNRSFKIINGELHYEFTVKVTMSYQNDTPMIESLESYRGGVNQNGFK